MKRALIAILVAALIAVASTPAAAYLKLGARVAGRTVTLQWGDFPVRAFRERSRRRRVSALQLQQTIARSFAGGRRRDGDHIVGVRRIHGREPVAGDA
jgi:hypothetical protein